MARRTFLLVCSLGLSLPRRRARSSPPEGDGGATERRRLVVLAGHTGDAATARAHLDDPDHRVRSTALSALERCRALLASDLVSALRDPSPGVRARACELAAHRPGVDLLDLLEDDESPVVETAAWALGERAPTPTAVMDRLAAVATGHADPLCRESAVAALGAIGDDRGLAAVLGALEDKPAVRRRAVLALAAFEGEEVEQALRKALSDRDWQVRQGAEDLLGRPGGPIAGPP